jgi:adenylate kinase family enzyme
MSIIIFTGIEGSGKTTVAKRVSEETGIPYLKQIRPLTISKESNIKWSDMSLIQTMATIDLMVATMPDIILDRFHIDELVYSKVMHRECEEIYYRIFDIMLKMLGAKVVYMRADYDIIGDRRKIDYATYYDIVKEYEKQLLLTRLPVLTLNGSEAIEKNVRMVLSRYPDCKQVKETDERFEIQGQEGTE